MAKFDKKLAQILTRRRLLADDAIQPLLDEVEKNADKSLSELLIERKVLTEDTVIGALAEEMNLPPINLNKVAIDKTALEAIPEDVARAYKVLPVAKIGNILTIAVANPFDIFTIDDVKIVSGHELLPVVSTDYSIRKAIEKAYSREEAEIASLVHGLEADEQLEITSTQELDSPPGDEAAGDDSPIIKLVQLIILQAIKQRASDIHIEIYEKRTRVRYRIDGALREVMAPPRKLYNNLTTRVKVMCPEMDIADRRRPQDGKFQTRYEGRKIDFRVSVLPTVHGEKVVIRILDTAGVGRSLDDLGFEPKALDDFRSAVKAAYGMVLVTGPTGSGKSTTLYSAIKEVMSDEDNISTVEDPVEYEIEGINQVAVNEKAGRGFGDTLRSLLRQDPDTIMIGEIRDRETAEIAVKAALTGHLVLSTLHTNDAASTVTRLLDMGIDAFLVSSSVLLVSAQRLVRKLCQDCKKPVKPDEKVLTRWGFTESEIAAGLTVYEPGGCTRCSQQGYSGRMALLETMPMSEELRRLVTAGASALDLKKQGLKEGMITLRRAGLNNALRGITSVEQVLSLTMAD